MSCYAWEHGTITLPSGQAPILRKVLTEAAEAHIARLTADTDTAWAYLKRLSPAKRAAVSWWNCDTLQNLNGDVLCLLQHYDSQTRTSTWKRPTQKQTRESVVTRRKDYDGTTLTVFRCGSEATITLRGNTVTWDVPENNRAPERANAYPLAIELFRFLDRVPWTARSGGEIAGNDEYNRDCDYAGGGGNYVVREYRKERNRPTRSRSPWAATLR